MRFGIWRQTVRESSWLGLLRGQGGQAMVEYSTITLFGSVVGGATAIAYVLPALLNAINMYLDSVYYVLNMPLP
ncbi:MAG: hypothetical protein JST54_17160 [Deltaproteobacteria bacterium]|nr:hypothetical protein [Deltaproteobacteria bacterium]